MPSETDITAHVEPPAADPRPEPGPMPMLYCVREWFWSKSCNKWLPLMLSSGASREQAEQVQAREIAKGHRRVQIVVVPGDAP